MIHILENGLNQKHMDMVFILGRMETDMKVNGIWLLNMELVLIFLYLEILTQVNILTVNHMEKVSIHGLTVQYMLEILKKV